MEHWKLLFLSAPSHKECQGRSANFAGAFLKKKLMQSATRVHDSCCIRTKFSALQQNHEGCKKLISKDDTTKSRKVLLLCDLQLCVRSTDVL